MKLVSKFQPIRLTQARKASQYNMTELAQKTHLTRQAISQFERGIVSPSAETMFRLAKELHVSESFFNKPRSDLERAKESPPSFRSMASATAKARGQAESYLEYAALLCSELFRYIQITPPKLPAFELADFENIGEADIEGYAEETRRFFGIGDGPISNLTMLLENHGVIVTKGRMDTRLEGISQWYQGRPFVLLDNQAFCARSRYSLAHELGHLVMHRGLVSEMDLLDKATLKKIERQADYFAGCFLMPETSFSNEFYRADWDSLVRLKGRWLVSIAAMVMRLDSLHLISPHMKTRLFQTINVKKARRVEPLDRDIPMEHPRLFKKIAEILTESKLLATRDWLSKVGLPIDTVSDLTAIPAKDFADTENFEMGKVVYLRA